VTPGTRPARLEDLGEAVPPAVGPGKRLLDLWLGSLALVVSAPLLGVAALAVRLDGGPAPVLYRAPRIGEGMRPFLALKLRTMRPDAGGSRVTVAGDARVTRVGLVLRRYRIDELPQLFNVLRGEMSLVGPRPEDPRYVDPSNPLHRYVFGARPGITGPAQLRFRDEASLLTGPDPEADYRDRVLPAKLALDAEYLRSRTLGGDVRLLTRTAAVLLPGRRSESDTG
jgi:lipopolysaccharide/colanic/teichoic acid biosynthesis glycosyltransferase